MCWLLLVIWFECKISRTISNPRLEITCFNPVELTPHRQRGENLDTQQLRVSDVSDGNAAVTCSDCWLLLWWCCPSCQPPATSGAATDNTSDTQLQCEALSVSSSWWYERLIFFTLDFTRLDWVLVADKYDETRGQTSVSSLIQLFADTSSQTAQTQTTPRWSRGQISRPGQFQIKTLRLGCGLLPAVNDGVRVWMFDYKGSRGAGGAYNPPITPALASINQGNVIRFVIIRIKLKYHWRWKILNLTAGAGPHLLMKVIYESLIFFNYRNLQGK